MIHDTPSGVVIDIRVIPRSTKTVVAGTRQNALLVRVAAPPVEGAANDAIVRLLARELDVPRSAVRIVAGERSREKRVQVDGVSATIVRERLRVD